VIDRVVPRLFEALAPHGLLVLGPMDGPIEPPRGFEKLTEYSANAYIRREAQRRPRPVAISPLHVTAPNLPLPPVELAIDDPRGLYLTACTRLELGDVGGAEVSLRRLLLLRPGDLSGLLQLALLARRRGHSALARHHQARLREQLQGRDDREEVESSGAQVAFIREVLEQLTEG
jgi:hypothetical protein